MASLKEIRARLQQASQKSSGQGGGDNAIFPHWDIEEGQTATVRFLPDGDTKNTFFWIEKAMINLTFSGIKGEPSSKPVTVQVPCVEMWGDTCPILTEVRTWFKDKDPEMEALGRKYWKKKSYLFQGFVVNSDMKEEKTPENPIRRFVISTQIFNLIKNALMDSEIEELPTDYVRGLDFRINKTMKGGYADYNTSSWARRERALGQEELDAIDQYGLFNLSDFLPKRPGETELRIMKDMFEASVDGQPYDMELWGQYFKPRGMGNASASTDGDAKPAATVSKLASAAKATSARASKEVVEDDDPPFESGARVVESTVSKTVETVTESAAASNPSSRAQDILAAIRNRNK